MNKKERETLYSEILAWFRDNVPSPSTELHYDTPFHLLISVILSAQCTDKRVNMYTPQIFKEFPEPEDLASATFEKVYGLIKSISFPNNKAKHLIGMANMLVNEFGGKVPEDPDELMMDALDAGAEDFDAGEEAAQVTTTPENFTAVCDALQNKGYSFISADVAQVPATTTTLTDPDQLAQMGKLLDALDDDDDVQNAWHSLENEDDLDR